MANEMQTQYYDLPLFVSGDLIPSWLMDWNTAMTSIDTALHGLDEKIGTGSITVDSELSETSENPVQNKIITAALSGKASEASVTQLDTQIGELETKNIQVTTDIMNLQSAVTDLTNRLNQLQQDSVITISEQPTNQTAYTGEDVTFTIAATSNLALSYQWQTKAQEETEWQNSTSATATTTSFTFTHGEAKVWDVRCIVTNSINQVTSNAVTATFSVFPEIVITTQPSNVNVYPGATWSMSVVAESTLPLTYQWYQKQSTDADWSVFEGATSSTITSTMSASAAVGGLFSIKCKVSNGVTEVESDVATLKVVAPATLVLTKTTQTSSITAVTISLTPAQSTDTLIIWQVLVNNEWVDSHYPSNNYTMAAGNTSGSHNIGYGSNFKIRGKCVISGVTIYSNAI